MPRASTRPGDLGPTDAVRQQVQVSLEKASGTLNASRLQKGLGRLAQVTARRTRSMTKPVSRAYLRHVRRTLLAIKTGRQGGRRETRSRHGRTGHRRAARATWTQTKEDAPGICVLRRPAPRFTSWAHAPLGRSRNIGYPVEGCAPLLIPCADSGTSRSRRGASRSRRSCRSTTPRNPHPRPRPAHDRP